VSAVAEQAITELAGDIRRPHGGVSRCGTAAYLDQAVGVCDAYWNGEGGA
jgi:hypothetical protein